jgi:hypothetical protein
MIRPFTLVCMLMAGGAGLYLYQAKHRSQMLDREIGKTIKQTEQTRERISMLKAEWALLNEPERLAELAKVHLGLRTLAPTQFVALNDIAARLPAPVAPNSAKPPTDVEPEEAPAIAQAAPPAKPASPRPAIVTVAAVTPAPDPKPSAESKPAQASAEPKTAAAEPKPARPSPHGRQSASVQVAAAPTLRGSLLAPVVPVAVNSAATAPGTVGEAVLRAMRANGYPAQTAHAAPPPAYARPAYAAPVVATPVYATPAYATPAYASSSAGSLLGSSRGALPPPVPFAAR